MKSVGKFLKSQAILCLLALFIVFLAISRPSFVSPANIKNVLMDASIYGVAAMAMTIAIITGAFDLSLSANFAWAQIFFCFLLNTWGDTAGGILLNTAERVCCPDIIKGGCLVFTGGDMIATSNTFIAEFGKGTFLGQSYLTYIFILVALVCHLFMKYTQAGRNFYATGGNIVSAKLSGIKVNAYRFATFVILGLAAGLAGCMYVCEIRAGSVLYGTDLSLTCIAATVVGGTSLSGGKGGVHRTVVGILLLYVMYKGLGFLGLGGYMNTMVKGIVLLLVVSFDAFVTQSGTKKA